MRVSVPSQCHATRIFVGKGERVRQVLIPAEIAKTPFASCGKAQVSAFGPRFRGFPVGYFSSSAPPLRRCR